jgi:iron complex outermembrane receptor protein
MERESVFAHIRHEFTDHIYLKVLGTYVDRKSANQAAPLPLFVGPDAGNGNLLDTVSIDATNPYNPFGFTLGPGTYSFVGRRLIENGPRHYEQDVNTWNITGTLAGDFTIWDKRWAWDLNAISSRNRADQRFTGNVNAANVQQALGPVALCTGSCVPLNLFGGQGSITPAMLDFIAFTQHDSSSQTLHDYAANLAGEIVNLPAGPLGLAVGYEHRDNSGTFEPDAIVAAGLSSDIPAKPASGRIKVDEGYAELRVPILADKPFANKLDVSLAGRWFDYSTSGSDSTYKFGTLWRPVDEVLLRASWGEGFRAPSIGEAFGTASRFDQEIVDPCSGLTNSSPANIRANCIANGVPADGSYVQINPQLPVFTRGNPKLVPETSKAWTAGFVWEPSALKDSRWARGGSIEIVFTDLELDRAIQAQNAANLLQRCAEGGEVLACSRITRTSSGSVSSIDNPLSNIGSIKTQAIDLNLLYTSPDWSWGQLTARWYTNFLLNFDEIVPNGTGFTTISREGTERGSPDQGYPHTKSNLILDWAYQSFGATLGLRYISQINESTSNNNKMGATSYVDTQVRWKPPVLNERFQLTAGVNNLFEADPPGCISCGLNNFDPNVYDPPGRFIYLRLDYKE